jgi:hypothetical protein
VEHSGEIGNAKIAASATRNLLNQGKTEKITVKVKRAQLRIRHSVNEYNQRRLGARGPVIT